MVRPSSCAIGLHLPPRFVRVTERHKCTGERGAQTLEFAVSAAIVLAILFGLISLSLGLYSMHFVAEAAQEGTRYAMVRGSGCSGLPSACPAKTSDIQSYVQGLAYPGIITNNIAVNTTYAAYPAGTTCTPSATCNNPGNVVTVTVTYAYSFAIPYVTAGPVTFTSTAAAVISE